MCLSNRGFEEDLMTMQSQSLPAIQFPEEVVQAVQAL